MVKWVSVGDKRPEDIFEGDVCGDKVVIGPFLVWDGYSSQCGVVSRCRKLRGGGHWNWFGKHPLYWAELPKDIDKSMLKKCYIDIDKL